MRSHLHLEKSKEETTANYFRKFNKQNFPTVIIKSYIKEITRKTKLKQRTHVNHMLARK